MSFLSHLDELRRRLLRVAIVLVVLVATCYAFADHILAFLLQPIEEQMGPLTVIRPAEAFVNNLKAALVAGIFVALPFVFWQVWAFVAPGLYRSERKWVVPFVLSASLLFLAGAAFSYAIALPISLNFLAEQGEQFENQITVDHAFRFSSKLLLGLGVVFELPLGIFVLARLGLVTARWLWKKLDIAIFVCFAVAAAITPTPDVLTMTIFAVPMIVLYLLGIVLAALAGKRERRDDAE